MQHLVADYVESIVRTRVLRSKEARAVSEVLIGYARGGEFQSFSEGCMRVGRITYRVLWHQQREYRFVFDLEASEICFPMLLTQVNVRSPVLKEINAFLRRCSTGEAPEHRRIDSDKGHARWFVRRGALTLTMTVRNGHYEYCTQRMVQIAKDMLIAFAGNRSACGELMHRVRDDAASVSP